MTHRLVLSSFLLLLATTFAAAADRGCSQGVGTVRQGLWDGYSVEIGPAPSDARSAQCRAVVLAADGKVIFETVAPEALVNAATGKDINGDGKPDVVIETHRAADQCCFTYSIISPGDSPPLLRQITTTPQLIFEDREGDGRTEISTHEVVFDGIDGLTAADSPAPLVVFRLKGNTLYNVSVSYWPDYEREITQARNSIGKAALELLQGTGANASVSAGQQKKERTPEQERQVAEAKGVVLSIVLNYLYGGRGQEAWKTVTEMWPDGDKERIRQLILKLRNSGVLSEVNRPGLKSSPQ